MNAGAFAAFFSMISQVANTLASNSTILLYFGIFLGLGVVGSIFSIVRR